MASRSSSTLRLSLAIILALLLALAAGGGRPASAAAISVNTTDDELNSDGDCSLREAISAANTDAAVDACTAGSGADTVTLPAGTYSLSIPPDGTPDDGQDGDLDIIDDVTITGGGAASTIIEACDSSGGPCTGIDRVFHVDPASSGITVNISGVTIRNGSTATDGGGIKNGGTLTLNNVTISGNTATANGGGIFNTEDGTVNLTGVLLAGNQASDGGGGGIFNGRLGRGTLTVTSSTLSNNTSRSSGGAIHNLGILSLDDVMIESNDGGVSGGGIFNQATATIANSTISDNITSSTGGGIDSGGDLTLTNSTVSDNMAGPGAGGGGGINNFGTMMVSNSTVNNNNSDDWGGGLSNSGALMLTNVTVTGNVAGGEGGGVRNHPIGTSTLANVTISGNTAASGGGIFSLLGAFPGEVTLKNTVVAGNSPVNCAGGGTITSDGHNLEDTDTCGFAAAGDLPNTEPLLGPLADNGGPTLTHALLPGSPAIDSGSSDCPPPVADQRGVPRPADGDGDAVAVCDIGAYEVACAADVNADGRVDGKDRRVVARALFSEPGESRWDPAADLSRDGRVDLRDLFLTLRSTRDPDCRFVAPHGDPR